MSLKIEELRDQGYSTEFKVVKGKLLDMDGHTYDPSQMSIENSFRFEGESNPGDMAILYAVRDQKGHQGYITNAYGVYSDSDVEEVIDRMNDTHQNTRNDMDDLKDQL